MSSFCALLNRAWAQPWLDPVGGLEPQKPRRDSAKRAAEMVQYQGKRPTPSSGCLERQRKGT